MDPHVVDRSAWYSNPVFVYEAIPKVAQSLDSQCKKLREGENVQEANGSNDGPKTNPPT